MLIVIVAVKKKKIKTKQVPGSMLVYQMFNMSVF